MAQQAAAPRRRLREALSRPDVRQFARQSALLFFALGVFNASNYLFHVVVSRLLGPAEYGGLAALLAVVMVMSVPLGVLHTVLAQRTAALRARGQGEAVDGLAAGALKTLLPVSWLAAGVVVTVFAPLLAVFLHLGFSSAVLLAPYVLFSILASVPLGVLQGEQRFAAVSAVMLASVAVRLGVGIGLTAAGLGVEGAVLATAVAPLAALAVGVRLLPLSRTAWRNARRTLDHLRGDFATALLGLTSFWVLVEIDIALARHFLEREEAGYYSSAGLLARALLFLPAAVAVVAFPRFVAARERGEGHLRWLRRSLVGVCALLLAALPVLVLAPGQVIRLAFGAEYAPAADVLPTVSVAMALMSVVGLLVYFHVAMGSRAYVLVIAATVVEVVLIALFHRSPNEIATVLVLVSAAVVLLQYQAAASVCRWRPALQRQAARDGEPTGIAAPASVEVSVVLPCHNAAPGLPAVLRAIVEQLRTAGSSEVIVVSDGSTDETVRIAEDFVDDGVRVIHYPLRGGKGQALRVGLEEARGEYVAFLDADGDIGVEAIGSFLSLMRLYQPDVVLGSKRHPLSEVYYPPLRRLLSRIYHGLARLLFRVNVRDTQTGCKLIRRDVLAAVLPRLLEKRYAFDLEFLVVARALGFKRVLEAPVRIEYRFASQVDPGAAVRIGLDTLAIFYRHYVLNTYREAGRRMPAEPIPPAAPLAAPPFGDDLASSAEPRARRVLFINWKDIRHPDAGGAEVFTHEVARRWVADGHEVTLLTSSFPGSAAVETIDGVRVRRLGRLRSGSFHVLVQRELARVRGFDVVIDEINTAPFLTPLWRRRLPPVVALIHQLARDVLDAELPRPVAAFGRWLEPRALRLYRELPIVTVSESTKRDLEEIGLANVFVVPDGVDAPVPPPADGKESAPTFLFVGRLAANKRPDHAVEAFRAIRRSLPAARLWIVGQGPLERRLAHHLPDGAELLGFLPRAELFSRMARAHCLLVPSVREGWGLVVIEANAVGTPAVGYDLPGIRDSIRDGRTGLLARAGDSEALAERALQLIADDGRYEQMRADALAWASQFSWDTTARRLLEVVEQTALASEPDSRVAEPVLSR